MAEENNEHFFEELAGAKNNADSDYEIELTKAASGVLSSPKTKTLRPRIEKEEGSWSDGEPEGQLTVDVYQTPNEIVVESAIAGVKPEDIDVNVTNDSISIRGSRRREKTVRDEDYLYQECYWGKFARSIILPQEVDPESAEVTFRNGILTVKLPKMSRKKSRKLKVKIE
jgi:HSP20 family protein